MGYSLGLEEFPSLFVRRTNVKGKSLKDTFDRQSLPNGVANVMGIEFVRHGMQLIISIVMVRFHCIIVTVIVHGGIGGVVGTGPFHPDQHESSVSLNGFGTTFHQDARKGRVPGTFDDTTGQIPLLRIQIDLGPVIGVGQIFHIENGRGHGFGRIFGQLARQFGRPLCGSQFGQFISLQMSSLSGQHLFLYLEFNLTRIEIGLISQYLYEIP